jgi:lipoprotein-releasing system permease protein
LGSLAILVSLAVLGGFEKMLNENAVKFTSHIKIKGFGLRAIPDFEEKIKVLKSNLPEISNAYPILERESLISSKEFVDGIILEGVNDSFKSQVKNNIIKGEFSFSDKNSKEIIIGKKLADKLNVDLGGEVIIYTIKDYSKKDFSFPEVNKFKVKAIYETGMAQYDDLIVYVPYATAGAILKLPENYATSIEIILNDVSKVRSIQDKIETLIDYPYNFTSNFYELHSSIFAWIEIQKEPIPLVLGLISIVAIFNIITILLITIVEKTKSIAILRTLGLGRRSILQIFMMQGLKIGLKGVIIGSSIAITFSILQLNFKLIKLQGSIYFLDSVPIEINWLHYLLVFIFTLTITIIATITPALIALRIKPAQALRFK